MLPVFRPSPPLQHLSISNGNIQVDASFMQTLWNVHPICSGSNVEEGNLKLTLSYLNFFFDLIKSSILPPHRLPAGRSRDPVVSRARRGGRHPGVGPERRRAEVGNTEDRYLNKNTDYQGLHTSPDLKRGRPTTLMNEKPLRLSRGGGG